VDWAFLAIAIWSGLVTGVGYAIFASGLTLIFGIMFVVNFAHGEIAMLGALLLFSLMKYVGIDFFSAAFISIALVALFGFIVNRIAVQPLISKSPWTVLLSTIAVSMIVLHGVVTIRGANPGVVQTGFDKVFRLGEVGIATENIIVLVIGLTIIIAVHLFLRKAKLGKDMKATIQDPTGANLVGINVKRVYDSTFIIASGLAAVSGILMSVLYGMSPFMGQRVLIFGFVVVIVAGMGNLLGAAIVGIFIGLADSIFSQYVSTYYSEAFIYGIMVFVLLIRPKGLFNTS